MAELVQLTLALGLAALLLLTLNYLRSAFRSNTSTSLAPNEYRKFKLIRQEQISPNTIRLRFSLASPSHILGLPTGKHISVRFVKDDGGAQMRSYTPISADEDRGFFELIVKIYPQGVMSQHLANLQVGNHLEVAGPRGSFEYIGFGKCSIRNQIKQVKSIGMVAGGTGITPMLQVIKAILRNPADTTTISLIFANVTEEDILLREELEMLQEAHANFKLFLTLDRPNSAWTQGKGFVSAEMMKEHLPSWSASNPSLFLFCGPPAMMKFLQNNAMSLEIPKENVYTF